MNQSEPDNPQPQREVEVEVDARGLLCPLPIIEMARAAKSLEAGTIRLLADDPAAQADVPAWCQMRGATLISTNRSDDFDVFLVRIG